MPYHADTAYAMGTMPQMPTMGPNGYADNLPSLANHQSMSARTSRSNSLMRPGTGVEENNHRRSMSAMEFANARINFNDYQPNGAPNGYAQQQQQQQQPQAPTNGSDPSSHYSYEHASTNGSMAQNGMTVKSEAADPASYGASTLPNVDGMPNGQDGSMWRNGSFNGDMNNSNSTAGGPTFPKSAQF
jgi:hypothetical protein